MATTSRTMPVARKRILVAASDSAAIAALIIVLQQASYTVTLMDNVLSALTSIEHGYFDLVILDVTNPNPNGFAACAQLRLLTPLPILLVNANRDHDLMLYGFKMGADDYMVKPLDNRELLARVHALLRRSDPEAWSGQIFIHDLHIDLSERKVQVGERLVQLSPIEFNLLAYMATRPGYIFSRQDLFHSVWGAKYVDSSNMVDVCIRRLRTKLEDDSHDPRYILTVRGVGYRVCSRD